SGSDPGLPSAFFEPSCTSPSRHFFGRFRLASSPVENGTTLHREVLLCSGDPWYSTLGAERWIGGRTVRPGLAGPGRPLPHQADRGYWPNGTGIREQCHCLLRASREGGRHSERTLTPRTGGPCQSATCRELPEPGPTPCES